MNTFELIDVAFTALEQRHRSPASTATVHKSYMISQDKNDAPCAGIGTVDASDLPVSRYWTVKIEARGRIHYVHVQACDAWKATTVALKGNGAAISAQIVREIDREEFEHLTRKP
jgi:hypothetical protein